MDPKLVPYSKFISLVLRHHPKKIDLTLDEGGWADVADLLAGMQRRGMPVDRALLERIVAENEKQRFSFSPDGTRIRANQGHSIQVDLGLAPRTPPELLYHGTARKNLESILRQGLLKRQRHAVHLSLDLETALAVGQRHGEPAVLRVQAGRMAVDGRLFYCSENGVWLTEHVPPEYLAVIDF